MKLSIWLCWLGRVRLGGGGVGRLQLDSHESSANGGLSQKSDRHRSATADWPGAVSQQLWWSGSSTLKPLLPPFALLVITIILVPGFQFGLSVLVCVGMICVVLPYDDQSSSDT